MIKTTDEHFQLFRKEVLKQIGKFGLGSWEIAFKHGCGSRKEGKVFASLAANTEERNCTFYLVKKWDNEITQVSPDSIKETALHEVLHLVVQRLAWMAGCRFVSGEWEIDEEAEATVKRLVNYITRRNNA